MKITVTGRANTRLRPELATLNLRLGFESTTPEAALEQATRLANAVGDALADLDAADPRPVESTALLPLTTDSWRPWGTDGNQLPLRFRANAHATLVFSDFAALSRFIDRWGREPGVSVDGVEWSLTRTRQAEETRSILGAAVADARARAVALAVAAGEDSVRFVELSDTPVQPATPEPRMYARAAMAVGTDRGGDGVDLTPEDIELEATVHAIFTTD